MPLLELRGVTKRFGGLVANDAVSLSVNDQEIVAVIGPNGAGKSTLFDVVTGFYRSDGGEILFGGRRVHGLPAHAINQAGIARTFQKLRLFTDMTALENVMVAALPRSRTQHAAREKAAALLGSVGLEEHLAKPAGTLSTGQRKRLEVARALGTEPRLLMLDEPLAGVDPQNVRVMIEMIRTLRSRGLTLVVVEHNMRAVMELADRVVAMHLGRKIADGLPGDVVADSAVVRAYLGDTYVER